MKVLSEYLKWEIVFHKYLYGHNDDRISVDHCVSKTEITVPLFCNAVCNALCVTE